VKELLPYWALFLSALSCVIAGWNVLRAGNWRKTDDAQALFERVSRTEKDQALQRQSLEVLERRFSELPTAAAVASLSTKVDGVAHAIDKAERGIERIEAHLMEKTS